MPAPPFQTWGRHTLAVNCLTTNKLQSPSCPPFHTKNASTDGCDLSYLFNIYKHKPGSLSACRPLTSFGSGANAASSFSENLADACVAVLRRLVNQDLSLSPVGFVTYFAFLSALYLKSALPPLAAGGGAHDLVVGGVLFRYNVIHQHE